MSKQNVYVEIGIFNVGIECLARLIYLSHHFILYLITKETFPYLRHWVHFMYILLTIGNVSSFCGITFKPMLLMAKGAISFTKIKLGYCFCSHEVFPGLCLVEALFE